VPAWPGKVVWLSVGSRGNGTEDRARLKTANRGGKAGRPMAGLGVSTDRQSEQEGLGPARSRGLGVGEGNGAEPKTGGR
jgi:hypothetical protein